MLRQLILITFGEILGYFPQVEVPTSPPFCRFAIKKFIIFGSDDIEFFYNINEESMLGYRVHNHLEQQLEDEPKTANFNKNSKYTVTVPRVHIRLLGKAKSTWEEIEIRAWEICCIHNFF